MDEPTSVLTPQAVEQLFETLRALAAEGAAIIYVSHKLDEIRRLCHRATILRAGRRVGEVDPRAETEESLASLMIGREFPRTQRRAHVPGELALELDGLNVPADGPFGTPLANMALSLRAGEILGIAGLSGNGQSESLAAITGERPVADAGAVRLGGRPVGRLNAAQRRHLGLVNVPEERLGRGTVPPMTLTENALLTAHRQGMLNHGLVRSGVAATYTAGCISGFDVRCGGTEAKAQSLSGGNLQKFIVGRGILQLPRGMVAGQPTWGGDVGAWGLIRQQIIDLAARGVGVLVISEDLGAIPEMCDRVTVIAAGRMSPSRNVSDTGADEIGRWMAGMFPSESAFPAAG